MFFEIYRSDLKKISCLPEHKVILSVPLVSIKALSKTKFNDKIQMLLFSQLSAPLRAFSAEALEEIK